MERKSTLPGIVLFAALMLTSRVPAEAQTISDFFDNNQLQELRVRMDPEDWATLKTHYTEDTYYRCEVQWRELTVPNSGIRSRGSGSRNPVKPGLGIDFSRFVSSQRFLGLKSVVLRNSVQDPSMLRERLAELLFHQMGIIASREAHARLYVNGTYEGVYLMVEPIDKRFLKSRFGEDTGYLYEMQPWQDYHFEWRGEDPAAYVPDVIEPKTHESESHSNLVDLIRAINKTPDEEFGSVISQYLDPGVFATHVAVDQYLANWDSLLNISGMTNFYLYQRTLDNRWYFLIWDVEAAFSVGSRPIWEGTEENVLIRRVLAQPEYRARYLEALRLAAEIAGGRFGWMANEAERGYEQIRAAVYEDPNRMCTLDGINQRCGAEVFEANMVHLRMVVWDREPYVKAQTAPLVQMPVGAPWLHPAGTVVTPGSLYLLRAPSGLDGFGHAGSSPLPVEMAGIQVKVGSEMAPIHSVSAGDVWLQVPYEVPCGPVSLEVIHHGSRSNSILVEARPGYPAIFGVTHASGVEVTASNPAARDELLVMYLTGLGEGSTAMPTGNIAPVVPLIAMKGEVTAVMDGQPAPVIWAGLAPGLVGVQVAIVKAPAAAFSSKPASLVLLINGEPGPVFLVEVR